MSRLYTLLSNLVKRLNFLGLGRCYENLCDTTNMLLVGPKYVGATQRVYTDDATTLSNVPSAWASGTIIAYRQVMAQYASGEQVQHAIVLLYEVYPIRGRVWVNVFHRGQGSTNWGGWKLYAGLNQGTMPSTANFNDYTYPANWWVNDLSTKTNLPSGASYGYLEVINPFQNGKNPLQRYTQYNNRDSWHRSYVNDTWSSWQYDGGNNFLVQDFTSSTISSYTGQNSGIQISYTVPTNYEYVTFLSTRTNGSIQLSYAESVDTSAKKIQCYYRCFSGSSSAPAQFTITVRVLFKRTH